MDRNHRAYRTSGMSELGDYGGHPRPTLFTIRIENKYHPITAGVEDHVFNAEQGDRNVESTR
jgi:hypothetical protein